MDRPPKDGSSATMGITSMETDVILLVVPNIPVPLTPIALQDLLTALIIAIADSVCPNIAGMVSSTLANNATMVNFPLRMEMVAIRLVIVNVLLTQNVMMVSLAIPTLARRSFPVPRRVFVITV